LKREKSGWQLIVLLFISVLPGLAQVANEGTNKSFLDPDMDPEHYAGIFENDTRDVYIHRDNILKAMNLKKGQVVADIGASTGAFLPLIMKEIGPTGHYYGVDIAVKFTEYLRKRADENGYANVTCVLNNFVSITLPANSIDVAFICDTYHHFDDPAPTLASILSALRPGGQLILVDLERIPGKTSQRLLDHVRAGKEVFRDEIVAAGFRYKEEVKLEGLELNYFLRFERP